MGLLRRFNGVVGTAQVKSLGSGTVTSSSAPSKKNQGWFKVINSYSTGMGFKTNNLIVDSSGNIVLLMTGYSQGSYLYKFNPEGSLLWSKKIGRGVVSTTLSDSFNTRSLTTDGTDYYVVTATSDTTHHLIKVTSAGAISWAKKYLASATTDPASVCFNFNSYITVLGHTSVAGNTNYDLYYVGYNTSGTLSFQRRTRHPDGLTTLFKGIIKSSNGSGWMWSSPVDGASGKSNRVAGIMLFATSPTGGGAQAAVHFGNATGSSYTLSQGNAAIEPHSSETHGMFVGTSSYDTSTYRGYIAYINTDLRSIYWSYNFENSSYNNGNSYRCRQITQDSSYIYALFVSESESAMMVVCLDKTNGTRMWWKKLSYSATTYFSYGDIKVSNGFVYVTAVREYNNAGDLVFFKVNATDGGLNSSHPFPNGTFTWSTPTGYTENAAGLSYTIATMNQDDASITIGTDSTITSYVDATTNANLDPLTSPQVL